MIQPTYTVYAQDFAGSEASRYTVGEYSVENDALTGAAIRVRDDLQRLYQKGQTAKELYDIWREQGEDVIIVPDDKDSPFIAIDFSRLMTLQIAEDTSRPLLLEVTCTDRLNTASGFSSPPKQWVFWVRAPATYAGGTNLIRRATEFLYREMSRTAYASEGSSYTLLHVSPREVTLREMSEAMSNQPGKTLYTVQEDGSFAQ